jgi:hypothetical protein
MEIIEQIGAALAPLEDEIAAGSRWPRWSPAPTVGIMSEDELRARWRRDARLLQLIGHRFARIPLPTVTVGLPGELAEQAAAAWDRDDVGPATPEDAAARLERTRAATLALIGAAVRERGRKEGDDVVVELGADLITHAVDAAEDDAG